MKRELLFSIAEIQEKEGLTFSETLPVGDLADEDWGIVGSCDLLLEFSVGGEEILMEGEIKGQLILSCSRCLEAHPEKIDYRLEETFPIGAGTINAGEEIRQALFLSVPLKSLCRADCLGLCPKCGKDLNQNPCCHSS